MPQITDIVNRPNYRVDLYIDPFLETLACLSVLKEEENDSEWEEWIGEVRDAMGESLWQEMDALYCRFYQLRFLMDFGPFCALQHSGSGTLHQGDFQEAMKRFRGVSDNDFILYMLGLEIEQESPYTAQLAENKEYAIERMKYLYGPIMTDDAVEEIFADPAGLKERCAAFLERFWDRYFSAEWERIAPYIMRTAQREEGRLVLTDIAALLSQDLDHVKRIGVNKFIFDDQKQFPIDLEHLQEVHFFLSSFLGRRLSYNILPDELILALYVPLQEEEITEPPEEIFRAFKGLADQQRLKMMRYLWGREATTSQLADLLSLAESTVSVHLKVLREAGLVRADRRKKNVFYTANRKVLDELNGALRQYFLN